MFSAIVQKSRLFHSTLCGLLALGFLACSSGGSGPGGDPVDPNVIQVAGNWSHSYTCDQSDCGESDEVDSFVLSIAQSGRSLTITTPEHSFAGQINGNVISWSTSYPEDGGTTIENGSVTLDGSTNAYSGTASWSWSDGSFSCAGTCVMNGSRI